MKATVDITEIIESLRTIIREELENFKAVSIITNPNKPINTTELCKYLGVTEPTILRWRKKGKIPFLQIGPLIRFDLNEVMKALHWKKKD